MIDLDILLRDADATWNDHCAETDRLARATMADTSRFPVNGPARCECGGRLARPKLTGWFVCENCGQRTE